MGPMSFVGDASGASEGQDHPSGCPRSFNQKFPWLFAGDVVGHHAVVIEVDVRRAVSVLHEREVLLGLLTHDEGFDYLAHLYSTAGIRLTVSEPLEVDIEGHPKQSHGDCGPRSQSRSLQRLRDAPRTTKVPPAELPVDSRCSAVSPRESLWPLTATAGHTLMVAGTLDGFVVLRDQPPQPFRSAMVVVPLSLAGGYFLPIAKELEVASTGQPRSELLDGFLELTTDVADVGAAASLTGPVLYIHSEFHGGKGIHEAMGWSAAELAFGPLFTQLRVSPPRTITRSSRPTRWQSMLDFDGWESKPPRSMSSPPPD